MKEYLENTLRLPVSVTAADDLYGKLPLAFKGRYKLYAMDTGGIAWLAIQPEEAGLVRLRKDRARIEDAAQVPCAFYFKQVSFYMKETLMEEGIPFFVQDKQVYLPFLGLLLNSGGRSIAPVHIISYLTQKLILSAIYENWQYVTATEAARKLNVSKMSVSRCFDELEYLDIDILGAKGKSRAVQMPEDKATLWQDLKKILRDPVIDRYAFPEDLHLSNRGGLSALCEYSLLTDNEYPTYALAKTEFGTLNMKNIRQASKGEPVGCVVLKLGYFLDIFAKHAQDPLSTALSLTDAENKEERVQISIKEMLREYVWQRD